MTAVLLSDVRPACSNKLLLVIFERDLLIRKVRLW